MLPFIAAARNLNSSTFLCFMSNRRRSATPTATLGTPKLAKVGVGFWQLLLAALLCALLGMAYRLWLSETSFREIEKLNATLNEQKKANDLLAAQNRRLVIEVEALKNGSEGIETHAREDLGLIKPDETFYLIVEE